MERACLASSGVVSGELGGCQGLACVVVCERCAVLRSSIFRDTWSFAHCCGIDEVVAAAWCVNDNTATTLQPHKHRDTEYGHCMPSERRTCPVGFCKKRTVDPSSRPCAAFPLDLKCSLCDTCLCPPPPPCLTNAGLPLGSAGPHQDRTSERPRGQSVGRVRHPQRHALRPWPGLRLCQMGCGRV